jgi:hypothetical protein
MRHALAMRGASAQGADPRTSSCGSDANPRSEIGIVGSFRFGSLLNSPAMILKKVEFLTGEFNRALVEYPGSDVQTRALTVSPALLSGDLNKINAAIKAFLDSTAAQSSYDRNSAYGIALDGRGDPGFVAEQIPPTVLRVERRADFERSVREGQMDSAASIIGIDQLDKCRAILRKLSEAINA